MRVWITCYIVVSFSSFISNGCKPFAEISSFSKNCNTKVTGRKAYLNQKVSEQSSNVEMSIINELKAEITFLVGEIKLKMI